MICSALRMFLNGLCLRHELRTMSVTLVFTLYLTIHLSASEVLDDVEYVYSPPNICPSFPYLSLEHGTIHRNGYQQYSFQCDSGYFLNPSSLPNVHCRQGNWTLKMKPRCLKKRRQACEDPPPVEHARVVGDERHVGSRVFYMCDEGYTLLGHLSLSCLPNKHWDKIPPECMDQNEPLDTVAERLSDTFVTELEGYSAETEVGKSLDRESVALGLELYLLIDRSSSIDPESLEKAKKFIKFLLEKFVVRNEEDNERGTRAAVIAFGTDIQTVFNIDDEHITNFRIAGVAVDGIQPKGGGTNMEGALTHVMVETRKWRPNAKRALFLMTDGEPNIANPAITPQDIAKELKTKHNFEIFTVGIGADSNTFLLAELASEPPLSHVFVLKDYQNLDVVMDIIEDKKPPPPPISKYQCGYNGTDEDRPWLATLYIGHPMKLCGGVLICSQWVITTATCLQDNGAIVDKKDVFVVLGKRNLLKVEQNQSNFYVTDIRLHPQYDPNSIDNDLALLRLNLPASNYRPACLPPTARLIPLHYDREINASVAGFGRSSASDVTYPRARDLAFEMESTPVSILGEAECPMQLQGMTLLCAGQGSRSCYSLLGSPLMAKEPTKGFYHVIGLQIDRRHCSFGKNQYVELTKFIVWINRETANCQLRHWGNRPTNRPTNRPL